MKPLWLLLLFAAASAQNWACPPIDAEFKRIATELNKTVACRCQEDGFYYNVDGVTIECSDSVFPILKDTLTVLNQTEVGSLKIWGSTVFKVTDDFFKKTKFKHLSIDESEVSTITEKAFAPVAKDLISLSLKNNQLNSKVFSLLKGLPKLQNIDLSGNVIGSIPKNIFPEDAREINLDSNQIRTIDDGAFSNLRNLKKLTLSHNQLESITANTFKGLDQLEVLILHHNHIQSVDYLAFAHMKKLRVIDLGTNDITGVELRNLPKLEKVFLNNNNIQSFKDTVLKDVPSLILVSMDRNFVSEIDDGDLSGLSKSVKMESLTLAANNISHIGSKALAPIQHVSILALQNNQLELLSEESSQSFLAPLYRLKTLLLSHNNVRKIRNSDLPRSIRTFAADHNKLEEIEPKSFEGIPVERIYLNDNRLTHLAPHIFDSFNFETLEAADITNNKWSCVCGKEWLVDWLDVLESTDRDVGDGVLGCLAIPECGLAASKKKEEEEAEARRSAWISIGATLLAVASIAILLIIAFMFITEGKHKTVFVRPKKFDSDMHKLITDTDHAAETPMIAECPTSAKKVNGDAKKSVRFADS